MKATLAASLAPVTVKSTSSPAATFSAITLSKPSVSAFAHEIFLQVYQV